jgi:quinol monooxygenase YgiN
MKRSQRKQLFGRPPQQHTSVPSSMKANANSNVMLFASGLLLGAISCFVLSQLWQPSHRHVAPSAFYLGVKVVFPNEADLTTFEAEFEKLAGYVRASEPVTLSYELLRSDKQPLQVYILERYRSKQDYLEVHKKSQPFLEFREKFQRMIERGAIVDGDSYTEAGIGFI